MGTLGGIVGMSFLAAIGILLIVLGCAIKEFQTPTGFIGYKVLECFVTPIRGTNHKESSWYAMFNLFFYVLAPIPALIVRRIGSDFSSFGGTSNIVTELALFFTAGIVVSAFGLPIVLARAAVIKYGTMALVMTGNLFIFVTILLFFIVFANDDDMGF